MSEIMELSPQAQRQRNHWNDVTQQEQTYSQYNLKNDQSNNCDTNIKQQINMETTMIDIKDFEKYSEVMETFESPINQQSVVPNQNINNQSYSELLQSPKRQEISFKIMGDYSLSIVPEEDTDDPAPTTSTPEHERKEFLQHKYKIHRPPNLKIIDENDQNVYHLTLDVAQCSPVKSPFPSSFELLEDSLLGLDDTILASTYDSPPPENINSNIREKKMMSLLQHFGIAHLAFIFIEQEVDVDLFLTLNDNDLQEIGIEKKTDRNIVLSVIAECNRLYQHVSFHNSK